MIPEKVCLSQGSVLVLRYAFHSARPGTRHNLEAVVREAIKELDRLNEKGSLSAQRIRKEKVEQVRKELNDLLTLTLPESLKALDASLFDRKEKS